LRTRSIHCPALNLYGYRFNPNPTRNGMLL
jgi:hypothetical protein